LPHQSRRVYRHLDAGGKRKLPHVHIALRGIDDKGRTLQLPREYVQYGIRKNAERLATVQIGYRTVRDAEAAQRREVHQKRYTSLDRIVSSTSTTTRDGQALAVDLKKRRTKTEQCILNARLLFLQKMGLAGSKKSNQWLVRSDFETILRAMQRTDDRQRSLAAHGVPVSDPRLPSRLTDLSDVRELEGRI
jgi:type IV secretory pathway VirD2 relaxase